MRIRVAAVAAVLLTLAAQSFAAYKVSVWIPPWTTAALTSIQANGGAITWQPRTWASRSSADGANPVAVRSSTAIPALK